MAIFTTWEQTDPERWEKANPRCSIYYTNIYYSLLILWAFQTNRRQQQQKSKFSTVLSPPINPIPLHLVKSDYQEVTNFVRFHVAAAFFTQSYLLRTATHQDNILFTLFFICILFVVQGIYLCSRYIDKLFRSVIYLNIGWVQLYFCFSETEARCNPVAGIIPNPSDCPISLCS